MLNSGPSKLLPSVKSLRAQFEHMDSALQKDKNSMDKLLKEEIIPVYFNIHEEKETLGWQFKSGLLSPDSQINEMNISFLGTGSMAYFGRNKVTTGDVLCLLSLQKATFTHQPTLLVKGIGTIRLLEEKDAHHPIEALHNAAAKYEGSFKEVLFGTGVTSRIQFAMENFFIPNFFMMVKSYLDNRQDEAQRASLTFNIMGHSRGAIESFYMISCVENFLQTLKNETLQPLDEVCDLDELCSITSLDKMSLLQCIDILNRIDYSFKLLGYDPVEGLLKVGDAAYVFGHDTTIKIGLKGLKKYLNIQCADMPPSVKQTLINFAAHEHRTAFQPSIPTFSDNTEVSYRVQFGTHSLMMGNIGNANGDGQDAFTTIQYDEYTEHLAHSAIDKVKLESINFLFNDNLPPLEQYFYRRIFSPKKKYAYKECANYLNELLKIELACNKDLLSFVDNTTKIKFDDNESRIKSIYKNIDLYIECCKWVMSNNQMIIHNAYFFLKQDINNFLYPSDSTLQNAKAAWLSQMRNDSTYFTGFITRKKYSLPKLAPTASRVVFIRTGNNIQSTTLLDLMPHQYETRRSSAACIDPSAETLSDLLDLPNNNYNPLLLKIDRLYTEIHNKIFMLITPSSKYTVQTLLTKPLGKSILEFFSLIKKTALTESQKIDAICLILLRMDKYKTCNVDTFCDFIMHHTKNEFAHIFGEATVLLNKHRPYQCLLAFLKESAARIKRYDKDYPTSEYSKINILKNKFNTWVTELDLNNVQQTFQLIIFEIKKYAENYKEEYGLVKRMYQNYVKWNNQSNFSPILQLILSQALSLEEEIMIKNIRQSKGQLKNIAHDTANANSRQITISYHAKKDESNTTYLASECLGLELEMDIDNLFKQLNLDIPTKQHLSGNRLEARRSSTK